MLNFLETGSSIDWSNPAVWLVIVVIILIIFFSVSTKGSRFRFSCL